MSLAKVWNIAGVAVVLLILLLGYVVGVSPALASASESDAELVTVEAQNQVKSAELAALKALSEDSDQLFADLKELDLAVPSTSNTSVFANRINALAEAAGVTFAEVSFTTAAEAISPTTEADVAPVEPAEGEEAEAEAAAEPAPAEPATSGTAVASVPGLIALGVNINVSGSPAAVSRFLASVQLDKRSFSVASIDLDTDPVSGESELAVLGSVYVLTTNAAVPVQTATSGDEVN